MIRTKQTDRLVAGPAIPGRSVAALLALILGLAVGRECSAQAGIPVPAENFSPTVIGTEIPLPPEFSEGGVGRAIRCEIRAATDLFRIDVAMHLYTYSTYLGVGSWKRWEQLGATRRADIYHVEFDWSVLPGEEFYYGTCNLCLTDWIPPREGEPENPQCATSAPYRAGLINGTPLPEPGLWLGLLAAAAFLCILGMLGKRLL